MQLRDLRKTLEGVTQMSVAGERVNLEKSTDAGRVRLPLVV
jgi:hypothetical protein